MRGRAIGTCHQADVANRGLSRAGVVHWSVTKGSIRWKLAAATPLRTEAAGSP